MRGAPHVGFSATIRKIRARISWFTGLRPPLAWALESHFQYSRKPARCQPTTVLGVTKMRGCFHRAQDFAARPRTACPPLSVAAADGGSGERAVVDGERGFRGRDPRGDEKLRPASRERIVAVQPWQRNFARRTTSVARQEIDSARVRSFDEGQVQIRR